MKDLTILLKPASAGCNLRCGYCFYADESRNRAQPSRGHMRPETLRAILRNVFCDLSSGDRLCLTFQGGEPTLVGLGFYQSLVEDCRALAPAGVSVRYALQTNGLLLDDAWCAFLREQGFLVGLSLDGPIAIHDAQRRDALGNGSYARVMQAKRRLDRHGTDYNVLMVLTRELARHPHGLMAFLEKNQLAYVQLIPCLGPLDGGAQACALTPERYASFYNAFFDLWLEAYSRGKYISVKLFDDYIRHLAFGECNACGLLGVCTSQLVVESDGSVYPCDFYALDEYLAGNLAERPLSALLASPVFQAFPKRPLPANPLCAACPFLRLCGGGCPRMRKEVFAAAKGGLCGHRLFLEHALERMAAIARRLPR